MPANTAASKNHQSDGNRPSPKPSPASVLGQRFRSHLVDHRSIVPLAILGILTGLITGLIMILFRWIIETILSQSLPGGDPEYFEALAQWLHFTLPFAGALVLAVLMSLINPNQRQVGIVHVLERLTKYHGQMPFRNAIVQFFAAILAIISGQSAGREGPAIHLGAATGSLLGQYWQLPNNSTRVLLSCGAAAAIAASFNTPLAGVIFAMEVILMEYTITGFTPVILAAVSATIVSRLVYGTEPAFSVPATYLNSLWELPVLGIMGLVLGLMAGLFIAITRYSLRFNHLPIILRFSFAGIITGLLALLAPQILGVGYDTLNLVMLGGFSISALLTIAACKLLATSFSAGMGMPIGIIGPSLLIGGTTGGLFAIIMQQVSPELSSPASLYVLVGMGAMMGAILNAPLAALVALLELTNTPSIILPGMLTIITATLMLSDGLGFQSQHQTILQVTGKPSLLPAILRNLQHVAAISVMNKDIVFCKRFLEREQFQQLLAGKAGWLAIPVSDEQYTLISRVTLNALDLSNLEELQTNIFHGDQVDMLALPLEQKHAHTLNFQATLAQAWQVMQRTKLDYLIIDEPASFYHPPYQGMISRHSVEDHYRNSESHY